MQKHNKQSEVAYTRSDVTHVRGTDDIRSSWLPFKYLGADKLPKSALLPPELMRRRTITDSIFFMYRIIFLFILVKVIKPRLKKQLEWLAV